MKRIEKVKPRPFFVCIGCGETVSYALVVFAVRTLKPYHYECLKKQGERKKWYKERRRYYD